MRSREEAARSRDGFEELVVKDRNGIVQSYIGLNYTIEVSRSQSGWEDVGFDVVNIPLALDVIVVLVGKIRNRRIHLMLQTLMGVPFIEVGR